MKIHNPLIAEKKIVICPLFDAPYNTYRNWPKPVFDELFNLKIKEVLSLKENQYLDKAQVMMNTKNGDMTFLKLKLSYFPKSNLMIQVNGSYTTQIFIMSDDKSVFYKGKIEKENIVLKKCAESEIVSE